ncbi:hypothetical protein C8J57DRAFT_1231276 [Mycena rebaudengoi]|nr:hypothetical protein C8J57DRAFT_1231276 [Mycena rebaudengoi]
MAHMPSYIDWLDEGGKGSNANDKISTVSASCGTILWTNRILLRTYRAAGDGTGPTEAGKHELVDCSSIASFEEVVTGTMEAFNVQSGLMEFITAANMVIDRHAAQYKCTATESSQDLLQLGQFGDNGPNGNNTVFNVAMMIGIKQQNPVMDQAANPQMFPQNWFQATIPVSGSESAGQIFAGVPGIVPGRNNEQGVYIANPLPPGPFNASISSRPMIS